MSDDEAIDRHVLRKYEIVHRVGKGAYGIVWKAINRKTNEIVALKKIFQAFQNDTDAQRTFREVMFLQELHHENIIRLFNVLKAENDRDIYLVFEFLDSDLHQVIKSNILEDIHKRYIIYQCIKALKYMHSAEVLHRDLKPSNLLLNSECHMKIADFGLARSIASLTNPNTAANPILTDYVATRWYRSPEILLGCTKYTKGVDMWAVGCILGEMLGGSPMFPGTSTMNQLDKIMEVTGKPTAEDIEATQSPFAAMMLENLQPSKGRALSEIYPNAPPDALDLLKKLLHFNPAKRLTAEQALEHPYLTKFHDRATEPSAPRPITIMVDDDEKRSLSDYRDLLYAEIIRKKKEVRARALKDA
ncbi:Kinase, CMGC MAPK [Giardia muris]|uniref:Mitogen-activated protein kinase n=1 Tax=Giardia muris TaxID=5742 RepID=A0A4Z1TAH5_GIAMU|nr:Kinase, CMGC MAPK [Giardia muris]|eukprot:TNJ29519.1 Kinase, CMGC MAPK [Giardia muris]